MKSAEGGSSAVITTVTCHSRHLHGGGGVISEPMMVMPQQIDQRCCSGGGSWIGQGERVGSDMGRYGIPEARHGIHPELLPRICPSCRT